MGAAMPIMMGVSTVAGLAGGIMNAQATNAQYQAQAANAAYQAQVAANNAQTARMNAGLDLQQGEIESTNAGMKTRAAIGATKAGEAASGIDVNSESFQRVRTGEAEVGMLDALTLRSNAAKKAWADETQATNFQAESGLQTQESQQAAAAGPVAATGSLLSSASSLSSGYFKYLQNAPSLA